MAAEAEREAQQRAHERLTWIKRESGAEKARQGQEQQGRRAAAEAEREAQQRVREQATWVKEERAASRQAESASQSKKLKDGQSASVGIKARHARKEAAPESKAARREEKERAARIRGERRASKRADEGAAREQAGVT